MRTLFRLLVVVCVALAPGTWASATSTPKQHAHNAAAGKQRAAARTRSAAKKSKALASAAQTADIPPADIPAPGIEVVLPETGDQAPVIAEPRNITLRVRAPQARRTWLYYQPDAGETRRYFLGRTMDERVFDWPLETSTGGKLFVAAEAPNGGTAYSTSVRVESGSYDALQRALSPDPHIRIEVNLPAFELNVYRDNQLLKRFRVGIGQKAWPVPPGLRTAHSIVWNPEWTPPSSPWATPALVARLKARGEVLGRVKIPLGGEILVHGTSHRNDLGRLVSHGCLRMFNSDVAELASMLVRETGTAVPEENIKRARANKRFSFGVALPRPVIVAIRYDPVVLRAGKVQAYKDVYGWTSGSETQLANLAAFADPVEQRPATGKEPRGKSARGTPVALRHTQATNQ